MIRQPPSSTLFPYTTLFRFSRPIPYPLFTPRIRAQALQGTLCGPAELLTIRTWFFERSEEHTSELQSRRDLVCRLLLEKKNRICHPRLSKHSVIRNTLSPLRT